jgi:hypothetical protein
MYIASLELASPVSIAISTQCYHHHHKMHFPHGIALMPEASYRASSSERR